MVAQDIAVVGSRWEEVEQAVYQDRTKAAESHQPEAGRQLHSEQLRRPAAAALPQPCVAVPPPSFAPSIPFEFL
jgi:hypothetical protein